MFLNIIRTLKIFVLLMLIDGLWLSFMGQRFYRYFLSDLFADTMQYSWAILFYLLYATAITHFILVPYLNHPELSFTKIFFEGFLFGLVVYSAYDLTNQATLKDWPLIVTLVDMLWGGTLTGIVMFLACKFVK